MSKYIDIEWLKKKKRFDSKQQRHIVRMTDIYSAPSIDIVRCKECKHGEYRENFDDYECHSSGCGLVYDADFYCADGERMQVMYYPQVDGITPSVIGNSSEEPNNCNDEPQNGYQTFNGTSVYISRFDDEPQTDCPWK